MDLDSGIQLNITTQRWERNGSGEKSKRVSGNRSQRIKARRAEKRAKERTSENLSQKEDDVDYQEKPSVERPAKRKSQTFVNSDTNKKPKLSTSVISSLFRHNPDVPVVKLAKVKSVKEYVFSSQSFQSTNLHPHLVSHLEQKLKWTQMTRVQQETIPVLLNGEDALVKSQTGSGKTYAYGIPIVQQLQSRMPKICRSDGPFALVIVPTRELATQSFTALQKLITPFVWLVPGCLMGGEKRKAEKARLRKGINILVATPGRLLDHIQHTDCLSLKNIEWLVIDEADRLLEMGYEKDVTQIIEELNNAKSCRQTVLLSATLTQAVENLAGVSLKTPRKIFITENGMQQGETTVSSQKKRDGTEGGTTEKEDGKTAMTLPENLVQSFVITPCKLRLVSLAGFILGKFKNNDKRDKMIVFMSTRDMVEFHHHLFHHTLCRKKSESSPTDEDDWGYNAGVDLELFKLHGDMEQQARSRVFKEFCETTSGILFCTDVAARGLHLPKVRWIVHYTCATDLAGYVHRSGRTARVGTKGWSLIFLTPEEVGYMSSLSEHQITDHSNKQYSILSTILFLQRQKPRTVEEAATYFQMHFETVVENDQKMSELARKAYQSYMRAYTTYSSSLKSVFQFKSVHLGHLAKSFALREAPSSVSENQKHRPKSDKKFAQKRMPRRNRNKNDMFEFSSGLDSIMISANSRKKKNKK
ncbi:hypothetical protein ScPMuIL_009821 [Solemya velum]